MGQDLQEQIWIWAPVCDGTKEAMWAHFTEDFTSPRLCGPARRRSAPVSEWRPRTHLYIDCISAIMVSSLHSGVNTGSRSNSEPSLRTPQRRWCPRPPRFPTEKTRFPLAAPSVDTQVRCFRMAALKFLLFSGKHGMGFFCQGRGRAPADVLALWIIRVYRLRRQKVPVVSESLLDAG